MTEEKDTKQKKGRIFNRSSVIILSFAAFSALILFISVLSPDFASFFNKYAGGFLRRVMAYITNIIPFSLAELLIILLPFALICFIIYAVKNKRRRALSHIVTLLSAVSVVFMRFAIFAARFSDTVFALTGAARFWLQPPVSPLFMRRIL